MEDISVSESVFWRVCVQSGPKATMCVRMDSHCHLDSHDVGLHLPQVWFPSEEWPSGTGHEWDGPDGVPIDPP